MRHSISRRLALGAAVAGCLASTTPALASAPPEVVRGGVAGPDVPFSSGPRLAARSARGPISGAKLERKLKHLAKRAPGASGYHVLDVEDESDSVLFQRGARVRRKLASNEKLFTTSTALSVLGADSTIETRVKVDGELSRAGRLKGNLYLIGGGDPSLGATGIRELATDVERAGIESVTGSVFGDDRVFDRLRGVPDSNYGPSQYIAPLGGLVYGGSTYSEDPANAAARAFRDELRAVGVEVGDEVGRGVLPKRLRGVPAVGSYESETIAELVAATNKSSNNFYAEMLLKRLDATDGHQGTTRDGAADVERYARSLGSGVSARDGSGLTDRNLSSPLEVASLLDAVREEDGVGDPLFGSLAIAGQDGTLASRMGGTAAAGRCRGKTGTIAEVSTLSGYCRSGGTLIAFSLLMNGVSDFDGARAIQDQMVVQIARYRP